MPDQFTSEYAVKPEAGFDISKLKGRSVVITGGGSGLGEEFAKQFAAAGAFVTIGDISNDGGQRVVSEIGEEKATFVQCNVLTWSDQVKLFTTAAAKSPSKTVDIVLANAGISGQDTVWRDDAQSPNDDPIEPNLSILTTNLIGVTYTAKLAVHHFSRPSATNRDKVLLMTSSLAGYLDQPGSPQYNSSKWGVRGMMHSLRRTMPTMGMRVNIIAPWFIRTAIMSAEVQKKVEDMGLHFAAKEDAGRAMLHLAADERINGRCCAIVPRDVAAYGYLDLLHDDFEEGDILTEFQSLAKNASHRMPSVPDSAKHEDSRAGAERPTPSTSAGTK